MKVNQVSVRLNEGGAAKIALRLHEHSQAIGHKSLFYYGYGQKGMTSLSHKSITGVRKLTPAPIAISNYFSSKLLGNDRFSLGERRVAEFMQANVVHFHAIHSHMMSLNDLVFASSFQNVKKIWTMHDYWVVTGRCAVPGACDRWRSKCTICPHLAAYPGTLLDLTWVREQKQSAIEDMIDNFILVSPSVHLKNAIESKFSNVKVQYIPNAIDQDFERELSECKLNSESFGKQQRKRQRLLIIANNLSDHEKTDWSWVRRLVEDGNCEVLAVGNNMPVLEFEVVYLGATASRNKLCKIMRGADFLLFTSVIDNSPLVLIEALSIGLPVVAKKSAAADEILSSFGADTFSSVQELQEYLCGFDTGSMWGGWSAKSLSQVALDKYSSSKMLESYLQLYTDKA